MTIELIADKLAAALRNYPCRCRPAETWPAFKNPARVWKCTRCEAIEVYDAHRSIVQTPGVPPK